MSSAAPSVALCPAGSTSRSLAAALSSFRLTRPPGTCDTCHTMPDPIRRGNPSANARIDRRTSARLDALAARMRAARDAAREAAGLPPQDSTAGEDRSEAVRACIAAGLPLMEIKLALADDAAAKPSPKGGKRLARALRVAAQGAWEDSGEAR